MTSQEINLHSKLSLLLNGYGSVENGQINIFVQGLAERKPIKVDIVHLMKNSRHLQELIVLDKFRSN